MGGLWSRSSAHSDEVKMKKEKKKRWHQQIDISFESDIYLVGDINNNDVPNFVVINAYDPWNKTFDQQQMRNVNDPPGAPGTYSVNYPSIPNGIMTQSLPSHYYPNNSFYQIKPASMSNIPYDPNQYIHAHTSNNQSQPVIFEKASPKKNKFAPSHHQQQRTPVKKPLTSTQSWHEPSIATNNTSTSITRPIPTTHGSITTMHNTKPSVPKPIYVDIDHKATLAERGQTIANNSDGLNSNPTKIRKRPHVRHQYKHQELFDSPTSTVHITPSKSVDSLQTKFSNSQRSMSANRLVQNNDQMPLVSNEMMPSRSRETHRQHRRRQQVVILPHKSPLRSQSLPRGIENKQHSNTPVMQIRTPQQQKQPSTLSANDTRTRI